MNIVKVVKVYEYCLYTPHPHVPSKQTWTQTRAISTEEISSLTFNSHTLPIKPHPHSAYCLMSHPHSAYCLMPHPPSTYGLKPHPHPAFCLMPHPHSAYCPSYSPVQGYT